MTSHEEHLSTETTAAPGTRFAAIIVNYNGLNTLLAAVQSLLKEDVPATQIVVVDNGSSDPSLQQLSAAAPKVCILRNGCNAGFARAVNRGIRASESEFILLLNNDAQLHPAALAAFADAFDTTPKLAIAGGQLRYPDGRLQSAFAPLPSLTDEIVPVNFLKWVNPQRYVRSTDSEEVREVESVFGACLAVRRAALASVGLLDEDFFFYFEEVEWCRRARLAGWHIRYLPGARATHLLGHTANRTRSEARVELQRSKLLYFRKCHSRSKYHLLSLNLVLRTFVNAVSGSVAVLFTLGLQPRLRERGQAYWHVFAWHLSGRPASWGLPGKCSGAQLRDIQADKA